MPSFYKLDFLVSILWGFKNMFLYPLSVSYMYKYVSIMIIVRIFAAKALKTPFRQIENLTDFILLLLLSGHGDWFESSAT